MTIIPMHKAKSTPSHLVKRAAQGETILIGGYGKPEAALTAVTAAKPKKRIGILSGKLHVPDSFDDPLPDDFLRSFDGGD